MEVFLSLSELQNWKGDVLAIGVTDADLDAQLVQAEELLSASISERIKANNFQGKAGEITKIDLFDCPIKKLIILGLGNPEGLQVNVLRKAAALAARASIGFNGNLGIFLPWDKENQAEAAKAIGEAVCLSLYKDQRFQSEPEPRLCPNKLELINLPQSANKYLKDIAPICAGVELARNLVGAPANTITPSSLAQQAIQIAKEYGLESKILERKDCEGLGMGAYLAVSQGSDLDPKFIHLTYKPNGIAKRKIAMIGKGVTFDSGGYNLKVGAAQIEMMKFDMGGSAAVLGAARSLAEIRPEEIEIHFLVASCENMINGSAIHPGDIVQASNKKTIEINNTDAEGRLTLADALVYACALKPDAIVDLATLTGACIIALGDEIAGLWSSNDQLSEQLIKAAESSGEELWRMPLHSSYKDGLKSPLADMKNTGPRYGGSITAALFLKEFVSEKIPWAHIDIAGTAWTDKDRGLDPSGATGYGVRTLVNWACNQTI